MCVRGRHPSIKFEFYLEFIYLFEFIFFIFIALDSSFVTSKLIALVQFYTSII